MLSRMTGDDTQTAYDGIEPAEKGGAAFRPDMILVDISLPKMDGYHACRAIRERPRGKDIVMVADRVGGLTGWGAGR